MSKRKTKTVKEGRIKKQLTEIIKRMMTTDSGGGIETRTTEDRTSRQHVRIETRIGDQREGNRDATALMRATAT